MPSGVLGARSLSPGVNQAIYVCGKTESTVATINVCNRNGTTVNVRIAISDDQAAPTDSEWIEYDASVEPNGVLERRVWVSPGKYIVVRSDTANVSASAWGIEQGNDVDVESIIAQTGSEPIWVTDTALSDFNVSRPFSATLVATNPDLSNLSYSLSSGSLPTGISLSYDGVLSGTPTGANTAGATSFTISASDGVNVVPRTFTSTLYKASGTGGTVTSDGQYTYNTFTSTGNYTFTAQATGWVEVLMWGGGGAGGTVGGWSYGAVGGGGGFSKGVMQILEGQVYTIVVAGGGAVNSYSYANGGGGRASNNNSDNRYAGGGGGYSGIFTGVVVSQPNALLIAGGGGGGGSSRAGTGNNGGGGGGLVGQEGFSGYDGKRFYGGRPGSQDGPGQNALSDSANGGGEQAALLGGSPRTNSYGGGGGGGYFGGSAGGYSESNTMAGGGGGSGFAHPSLEEVQLTGGSSQQAGQRYHPLRATGNAGYGYGGDVAGAGTGGAVFIRWLT